MGLSTYWCVWWLCWWSVLFHWAEYRWVCRQTDGLVVDCAKYRWDCGCTILLTANGYDHVVECRDCCRHTDWLWCHRGCSEYKINGVVHHVGSGHQLLVEFNAHKEKLMKEKITLRSATSDEVLFLIFHARVLGEWSELYAVSCTPDANACIPSCTHYKIYWFTQVRTHTHTQHTHIRRWDKRKQEIYVLFIHLRESSYSYNEVKHQLTYLLTYNEEKFIGCRSRPCDLTRKAKWPCRAMQTNPVNALYCRTPLCSVIRPLLPSETLSRT